MKKITILFLLFTAIVKIQAQNYQISFAGTGASTTVDSVKIENFNKGTIKNIGGNDVLSLVLVQSIDELNNSTDNFINIYPNPMSGECTIEFEATSYGNATIELFDVTGKSIFQIKELLSKGNNKYMLSGIKSGIYTIKIVSDNYSYTSKIISNNSTTENIKIKHIEANPIVGKQITHTSSTKVKMNTNKVITEMQYTPGDRLMFTGKSGNYKTVFILVPTQSQTVTFNFAACTDADNNNYAIVKIGIQTWMQENLKTTKYRNGNSIPNITDNTVWSGLTTGAYCNYNYTNTTYGKLYNWFSVADTQNICPIGWHIPSDAEWTILSDYLINNGYGFEGSGSDIVKSMAATYGWNTYSTACTVGNDQASNNSSGFTAFPGGYRHSNGSFDNIIGLYGDWWSSSEVGTNYAWNRSMVLNICIININNVSKKHGFSVRCLRD